MKRIVVSLLIVVLLIALLLVSIPMLTMAEAVVGTGTMVGATITEKWTGKHKTEAELESETGKAFTPITTYDEFSKITDGTSADDLAYYCLILPEGTETLSLTGSSHIKCRKNIYFDFNGYTVDVSGDNNGVFGTLHNCTIKNLKLTGTLRYVSDRTYYSAKKNALGQSPLTTNGYGDLSQNGIVHLDNIVSEVKWTIHQQHGYEKYSGAIISSVESGSTISNCVFNGSIVSENDESFMADTTTAETKLSAQPGNIGGIIGYAEGVTFTNCISKGTITIAQGVRFGAANVGAYVGGIAGNVVGASTLSNCRNEVNIDINAYAWTSDSDSTMAYAYIGGIAGYVNSATAVIDHCTNAGVVKVTEGKAYLGGIVGTSNTTGAKITNCTTVSSSKIIFTGTAKGESYIGMVMGRGNGPIITDTITDGTVIVEDKVTGSIYVGGMIGHSASSPGTITECTNKAYIDIGSFADDGDASTVLQMCGIGGFVGRTNNKVAFSSCTNEGNIHVDSTALFLGDDNWGEGVGGILGNTGGSGTTFTDTVNKGSITVDTDASPAGGILGKAYQANASFNNVVNEGVITGKEYVGGIVGVAHSPLTFTGNCVNKGNVKTTGSSSAGGVVGLVNGDITVSGADNAGTVEGEKAGGIVGQNTASLTLCDCDNSGSVKGNGNGGGILAYSFNGTSELTVSISDCTNTGNVSSVYRCGGIVGYVNAKGTTTVSGCTNGVSGQSSSKGTVTVTSCDTWSGSGGIVGYAQSASRVTVKGSVNYANISCGAPSGVNLEVGAGGIVGRAIVPLTVGGSESADKCTNYGNVTTSGKYGGGIVGVSTSTTTISNCENSGDIAVGYGQAVAIDLTDTSTSNDASVVIYTGAGGILGAGDASNTITISGCKNYGGVSNTTTASGSVKASEENTNRVSCTVMSGSGGIVGVMSSATAISSSQCDNAAKTVTANISNKMTTSGANTSAVSIPTAGGIAGYAREAATLTDLNANINVYSRFAGGILGYSVGTAKISGCVNGTSKDNVTIASSLGISDQPEVIGAIGGILGNGAGDVHIAGCINYAKVHNPDGVGINAKYAGGLVGRACKNAYIGYDVNDTSSSNDTHRCYNYGTLQIDGKFNDGHTQYTGGIAGMIGQNGKVARCYNYGAVNAAKNPANTYAGIGGIIGVPYDTNGATLTLSYCYNYGDITAPTAARSAAGGMIGRVFANDNKCSVTVTNCCNYGDIIATYAGGIVGKLEGGSLTVSDCTNNADLTAKYVGGIVALALPANDPKGDWSGGVIKISGCTNGLTADEKTLRATVDNGEQGCIGGIVASTCAETRIADCKNYAKLYNPKALDKNAKYIGGILGYAKVKVYVGYSVDDTSQTGTEYGCCNYGTIDVDGQYNKNHVECVGGIAGYPVMGGDFAYCSNAGDIYLDGDAGTSWGGAGGIVGFPYDNENGVTAIIYCENSGDIIDTAEMNYAIGGIAGRVCTGTKTLNVENCTNTGELSGKRAGGIIGKIERGTVTVKNTQNFGDVSGTYVGGFIGETTAVRIDSCTNSGAVSASDVCTSAPRIGGFIGSASGLVDMDYCTNNGTVSTDVNTVNLGTNLSGIGGLLGYVTSGGADLDYCTNNAPVSANAPTYSIGGLIGYANGAKTLDYCENTNNGVITTVGSGGSYVGMGGIAGMLEGGTAEVVYCENNGRLQLSETVMNAGNIFAGGIIGRSATNCATTVNYCINNGEADCPGTQAGGIIGYIQTWNAAQNFTCYIKHSVNNARISASTAAGIFAYGYPHGNGDNYLTVVIQDCVNDGEINATQIGAGIAASFSNTSNNLTYTLTNCVNLGTVFGGTRAGILANGELTATITNCINGGSIASGTNAYAIVPTGDKVTVTSCSYLEGGAADSHSSSAVDAETIKNLLDGLSNAEDEKTGVITYDKDNIQALFAHAIKVTDASIYGDDKEAFENARNVAKLYAIKLQGVNADQNLIYFTATQAETDLAYQTLYDIMYGKLVDEATFVIYIPESITLDDGGSITGEVNNFNLFSKLDVTVSGDFTLYRVGDAEDTIVYCLIIQDGNGNEVEIENGDTIVSLDATHDTTVSYPFTTKIKKDSNIPGRYEGSLTFTVSYSLIGQ